MENVEEDSGPLTASKVITWPPTWLAARLADGTAQRRALTSDDEDNEENKVFDDDSSASQSLIKREHVDIETKPDAPPSQELETVNLTRVIIPFQSCDQCERTIRGASPPIEEVWKCKFCRSFALCSECMAQPQSHSHFNLSQADTFFQRVLTYHEDCQIGSDYIIVAEWFSAIWMRACEIFFHRPCLGVMSPVSSSSSSSSSSSDFRSTASSFEWLTYGQVWKLVSQFAVVLRASLPQLTFDHQQQPDKFCGCHTGWLALVLPNSVDWVGVYLACLYLHIVVIPIDATLSDVEVAAILDRLQPKLVVVQPQRLQVLQGLSSVPIICSDALRKQAGQVTSEQFLPSVRPHPNCVIAVSFTSGTTGSGHKGVLMTDDMMYQKYGQGLATTEHELVAPVLLPLSSSTACAQFLRCLCVGGSVGLISTPAAWLEEVEALRPTVISAPPAMWSVARAKFEALRRSDATLSEVDVCAKFRCAMGGNVGWVSTGGAKVDSQILDFLRMCFGKGRVGEGYGATEVGSITANDALLPGVTVRLLDVPELGFLTTDKPYPRGEICVATPTVTPGYLLFGTEDEQRDHDTLQQFVVLDGTRFYRTGDIGELIRSSSRLWGGPDRIRLLDRAKHFFKATSGKFISPETIESVLEGVCATWLTGVFIPSSTPLVAICMVHDSVLGCDALTETDALRKLADAARKACLPAEQTPLAVALCPQSDHNFWYNGSSKKQRTLLRQHYQGDITKLIGMVTFASSCAQPQSSSTMSDKHRFFQTLTGHLPGLNMENCSEWARMSFSQLGGTSLHAMHVVQSLASAGHTAVALLQASSVEQYWAIHSGGTFLPKESAFDWSQESELPVDISEWDVECSSLVQPIHSSTPIAILMTGCTGFLGRFVLDSVLRRYPTARITCLVRGVNDDDARMRLEKAMQKDQLLESDTCFNTQRVGILASHLDQPCFGLSAAVYSQLATTITHVVHCAAKVHFVLPFADLRSHNVTATLHVLRFCKTIVTSPKRLVFVSTQSVEQYENAASATTGYVQSKRVSELHVKKALGPFGFIVRPVSILGHSETGVGTPPVGDWVASIWTTLAHHKLLPDVSTTQMTRRLVAVNHVSDAIAAAVFFASSSTSTTIINPGPIITTCIADMLRGVTSKACGRDEWLSWLHTMPSHATLQPHRELLLREANFSNSHQSSNPLCATETLWFTKCLLWLINCGYAT